MGGGAEKSALRSSADPPPFFRFLNRPGIALMGSLQISTGSGLGKVVHAIGL